MANYTIARPTNQEIAGNSDELVGRLVGLRSDGVIQVDTKFGKAPATRVTAVELSSDGFENMGLRLIFWSQIQRALNGAAGWVVGRIASVDQTTHEDRVVYVLEPPTADEIPFIGSALDAYEAAEAHGLLS